MHNTFAFPITTVLLTISECDVFFIDYGNTSVSTDLRHLPDELATIPAWAVHCSLPSSGASEAIDEAGFTELTSDLSELQLFYRTVDTAQSPQLVRLFFDADGSKELLVRRSDNEEHQNRAD